MEALYIRMLPVGVKQMLNVSIVYYNLPKAHLNSRSNAKKDVKMGLKRCCAKMLKLAVAILPCLLPSSFSSPQRVYTVCLLLNVIGKTKFAKPMTFSNGHISVREYSLNLKLGTQTDNILIWN